MLPENHVSNFPTEWWTERRCRDYLVDDAGCVQLRDGSETALILAVQLVSRAYLMGAIPLGHA